MSAPPPTFTVADAPRIEQACAALDQATDSNIRSQADAFLQSVRESVRPYTLMMTLLQGSQLPSAQYLALATIKYAIEREGRVLGVVQMTQMKDQLLQCIVQRAKTWVSSKRAKSESRYVLNQSIHVLSILFKWMCLNSDDARLKAAQAQRANAVASSSSAAPQPVDDYAVYIGIANGVGEMIQRGQSNEGGEGVFYTLLALELSKALIIEFTQGTQQANAGVSVSQHVRCHSAFETHVLLNLAQLILQQSMPNAVQHITTINSSPQITNPTATAEALTLLHSYLNFLDSLLSFPFTNEKNPEALGLRWALGGSALEDEPSTQLITIKPSKKWRGIFVQSQLIELLGHTYGIVRNFATSPGTDPTSRTKYLEMLHLIRTTLLHLSSMQSSQIFQVDVQPHQQQYSNDVVYFTRLTSVVCTLMGNTISACQTLIPGQQQAVTTVTEELGIELIGHIAILKRLMWRGSVFPLEYDESSGNNTNPNELNTIQRVLTLLHTVSMMMIPYVTSSTSKHSLIAHGGQQRRPTRQITTDTSKSECFELCLETWSLILEEIMQVQDTTSGEISVRTEKEKRIVYQILPTVRQYTGSLFEKYVTGKIQTQKTNLMNATKNATQQQQQYNTDEEDEDEEDEGQYTDASSLDQHLRTIASLGTFHVIPSLQLMTNELNTVMNQWKQLVQSESAVSLTPSSVAMHQLYSIHEIFHFLLNLLRHFLCHEVESSQYFISIPFHILQCLRDDTPEAGMQGAFAVQQTFEMIANLATIIQQVLEHKLPQQQQQQPSSSTQITHSLKSYCSPLVLESFTRMLKQLLTNGYIGLDLGRWDELAKHVILPRSLLQMFSGGNEKRTAANQQQLQTPQQYGALTLPLITHLFNTSITLLCHYHEEVEVIDEVLALLKLSVKHIPIKMMVQRDLLAGLTSNSGTVQQPSMLPASSTSSSLLLAFQSTNRFYSLDSPIIRTVSQMLTKLFTFEIETDCNEDGPLSQSLAAKASTSSQQQHPRRIQSYLAFHSLLLPIVKSFFGVLHNPAFFQYKSSNVLNKSLTHYISFFTGLSSELYVDNFEYLWLWFSATDAMLNIPLTMVDERFQHNITQLNLMVCNQDNATMRGGVGQQQNTPTQPTQIVTSQSILQMMVEILRAHITTPTTTAATSASPTSSTIEDASTSLHLLQSILLFSCRFSENFIPYLNKAQSYRFMQFVLALVNVCVGMMEKYRSQAAKAMMTAQVTRAAPGKVAALEAELTQIEEAEWDILNSLLLLLESVASKDRVDLSSESVEFAGDAVLNGLVLVLPRLSGNMLAHPEVSVRFFEILSQLVGTNPEKLAVVLNEQQRNQLMQMILFVFESEIPTSTAAVSSSTSPAPSAAISTMTSSHTRAELLKYACSSVQSISQYHLYFVSGKAAKEQSEAKQVMEQAIAQGNTKRISADTMTPPPPSPFAPACAVFLQTMLRVLLHAYLTPMSLQPLADAMLPTILCQPQVFIDQVRSLIDAARARSQSSLQLVHATLGQEAALTQQQHLAAQHQAIEAGFQQLIPSQLAQQQTNGVGAAASAYLSSKTMAVSRSEREKFRAQIREFVLHVRPLLPK